MRLSGLCASVVLAMVFPVLARERLPTVDVSTTAPASSSSHLARPGAPGLFVAHEQTRLGVPTFVRRETSDAPARAASSRAAEAVGRELLSRYASLYRLERVDAEHVPLRSVRRLREGGGIIHFGQQVGGVEVFRQSLKVLLDSRGEWVAMSGHLSPVATQARFAKGLPFALGPEDAIARAWQDLEGHALPPSSLEDTGKVQGTYRHFELSQGPRGVRLSSPARVKPIYFPLPELLVPAYYVELGTEPLEGEPSGLYAYAIAADDGRLLYRHSLVADSGAFTYQVWADAQAPFLPWDGPQGQVGMPHPTGLPDGFQAPFLAPGQVTLRNAPFSRNDPWLPPEATHTRGNNAEAYADLAEPDGYGEGDLFASITGTATFEHGYDHRYAPGFTDTQRMAGVTHLFYVVNFLHDWFYDSGFDEAAGNAQDTNFARGGLDGDSMKAETQDFQGRSNANMETPADGARPRMQMFVFDSRAENALTLTTASGVQGPFQMTLADYGSQRFDLSARAVWGVDGVVAGEQGTPTDGCEPLTNGAEVVGKVVLLHEVSGCAPTLQARHAQQAGALAVYLVGNRPRGRHWPLEGRAPDVHLPVVTGFGSTSRAIREAVAQGETTLRLVRGGPARDAALDSTLVTHEWMHYMSNRLIGDGNGLTNNQGFSLGEGWSDFGALLLTTREEDALLAANAGFGGTYTVAGFLESGGTNQGYYWGLRRYPYSTNLAKNPLTFRFIEAGVPLPEGIPVNPSGPSREANPESHNSGEVWAVMLWECYVALLRDSPRLTFDQAQSRMKDYLVASLAMTPVMPTFLEARDALLAVAHARDARDAELFAQAFARRGAGLRAVAPHRESLDHLGVVESHVSGKDLSLLRTEATNWVRDCDGDGVLDAGDELLVRLTFRNVGTARLERSHLRVSSRPGGLGFPGGAEWALPPTDPFETVSVEVPVTVLEGTTPRRLVLGLTYWDEHQTLPQAQDVELPLWVSRDEQLAASTTETVEARHRPWRFDSESLASRPWERLASDGAEGHYFHGPNLGVVGLRSLVSPPLHVSTEHPLRFSFRHRHDIETHWYEGEPPDYKDGAVLELSTDDGLTWTDIGEFATPTYNAFIEDPYGNENPLSRRPVYSDRNAAYPEFEPVSVDLGMAYAGQTVRVRFAYGTDYIDGYSVTLHGWDIDDVQFEGLVNTPFTAVVDDAGACLNQPPTVSPVPAQEVNEERRVTVTAVGTDPDGDALTYMWTQTSGPPVALEGATTATVRFEAPRVKQPTQVVLRVVASDGALSSTPVDATIHIRDSKPDGCDDCASGGPGAGVAWLLTALGLAAQQRRRQN
ncbi:myxosortase-dependent M36 family metallopeptidase [Myxococcus sp. AB025B]|uniref:myxosortase-dependent M36 family metallopeptidase n=1 Tax=Myxococcus sp. AB025B TaxID=2562794 RepID=UPI0011431191|nr:myxosortase-dependent M36 family metallopeptidase [Myxococcus sp. AB025B]